MAMIGIVNFINQFHVNSKYVRVYGLLILALFIALYKGFQELVIERIL